MRVTKLYCIVFEFIVTIWTIAFIGFYIYVSSVNATQISFAFIILNLFVWVCSLLFYRYFMNCVVNVMKLGESIQVKLLSGKEINIHKKEISKVKVGLIGSKAVLSNGKKIYAYDGVAQIKLFYEGKYYVNLSFLERMK